MNLYTSTLCRLLIIALSVLAVPLLGQDTNKLSKANTLFKAKRYAEAIPLYEEILERDFNKNILLKLARSHRKLNNLPEALKHFSNLMAQPEVKSDHQLEYVEVLIMNGDYTEAKEYLTNVKSTNTNLKQIFQFTSMINNNFDLVNLYEEVALDSFQHNGIESDENSPFFLGDKLIFTSDRSASGKIKKKSGMTGRDFYKIWESAIADGDYSEPKTLNNSINASNKNTANAVFDVENQVVFFSKNDNTKDLSLIHI